MIFKRIVLMVLCVILIPLPANYSLAAIEAQNTVSVPNCVADFISTNNAVSQLTECENTSNMLVFLNSDGELFETGMVVIKPTPC